MSLRFLLDTNVVSEPLRPNPNRHTLAYLHQYQDEMAIASVVWHELYFGYMRLPSSAKKRAIGTYLSDVVTRSLTILPYDTQAATWHASERARLMSLGKTPAFINAQIASIAAVNNLILVTANVSDYDLFDGVEIQNWMAE